MKTKNEREIRFCNIQFRDLEDPKLNEDSKYFILEGLPIVFNQKTKLGTFEDEDIYEVIEADAFNQTDISDVVFNVNHGDGNHAVARTRNNTLKLDKQDDGIHCTVYLDKSNPRCVQVYKDVSSGLLDRMSFAFTIKEEEFDKNENCYHIKNIDKVYDVSAVEFPAYESTSISARRLYSAVAERELAVAKNLETKRELLLKRIERNI